MARAVRLLIVEDEETIRNGMAAYLQRHAGGLYEVYTADNGQSALDLIFRYRPELMLLDINLPVKDGLSVMKEATAAGALPHTIILSGYNDFTYAQQGIRYGVVDYLLKPCRSSEILSRINEIAAKVGLCAVGAAPEPAASGIGVVRDALRYIAEHYPENITLSSVANKLGISPGYLSTLFGRELGCRFVEKLNEIRIERAIDYFHDNRIRTYEVAYKVGYRDEKYFSSVFKKLKGKSPSDYRKTMEGRRDET